jgi:hypothetical protein
MVSTTPGFIVRVETAQKDFFRSLFSRAEKGLLLRGPGLQFILSLEGPQRKAREFKPGFSP